MATNYTNYLSYTGVQGLTAGGGTDYSTAAGFSLAAGAIGSVSSAVSTWQAGQAAQDAYDFQAKVARLQAREAIKRGDQQVLRYAQGARQLLGSQRAALAAQGADLNQDTAARIQSDTQYTANLDIQTLKNNAFLEAFGYKTAAVGATISGQQANIAGQGRAASSLLTGLGETAYRSYSLRASGAFG